MLVALWCLAVMELAFAQGEVSFIARRDFRVDWDPPSVVVGDFNGDGRPDLATANVNFGTVSILLTTTPGVVVNDLVTFEPIPSTFTFTPDLTGYPIGFGGIFRFEARLTNSSDHALAALVVAVTRLANFSLLQNADGGLGGTSAWLPEPRANGFADGVLSPEEFVNVPFRICLTQRQPFGFEVAVVGVADYRWRTCSRVAGTGRGGAGTWAWQHA